MIAYKVFREVGDELHSLAKYKNHWGISYQMDMVNVPTLENSLLFVFETQQQAEDFARLESPFRPPLAVWSVRVDSLLPCRVGLFLGDSPDSAMRIFWELGQSYYGGLLPPSGTRGATSVKLLEHISSWSYGEKI